MKKQNTRFLSLILSGILMISAIALTSCSGTDTKSERPTADREGTAITLPDKIERVISAGASNTEILVALGVADKIIAVDTYSANVEGLKADIPQFDQMTPDGEQIIALEPDVIFVTAMAKSGGDDPYKPLSDAGICVIYMPSSISIDAIKEDIRYMGDVMEVQSKCDAIIKDMEKQIDEIKAISDKITDKKTVYFEIAQMYSLGSETFINNMIELAGAKNIFADQTGYIPASDETILNADPDVILTTTDYIENPTEDIKSRPGWDALTAVQNDAVYYIDTDSSNRPSHNMVKALRQIAEAIYPELYK